MKEAPRKMAVLPASRAPGIAAADGLADANGGGGGDAERNHVSESDGVEGDLVAGEGDGAEAADERCDQGEDGDFGGVICRAAGKPRAMRRRMRWRSGSTGVLKKSVRWRRSYQRR